MAGITSRLLDRILLVVGATLVGIYLSSLLHQELASHFALWQFESAAAAQHPISTPINLERSNERVDFSLWAQKRIKAYKESLLQRVDPPIAVLQIRSVRIRVPVFYGTDDITLNRGVGWIRGTAKPATPGNIGIAGHRDGFFRGLKDVRAGDPIDLTTNRGKVTYIVDEIEIVNPSEVNVLQPRNQPALTLVTCYPFYFLGDAPKRFVVHAFMTSVQENSQTAVAAKQSTVQEGTR
jgi:sortase A